MSKETDLLYQLRFDTVDGLYLQENDVETDDFIEMSALTDWLDEHPGMFAPSDEAIAELSSPGSYFRRNYSIYDHFVPVTAICEQRKLKNLGA